MADARICDRCGSVFASRELPLVGNLCIELSREVLSDKMIERIKDERGRLGCMPRHVELCDDCTIDLDNWFNGFHPGERQDEVDE